MEPSDLAPATRKRRPAPPPPAAPVATGGNTAELVARLGAVESALRTIDVRLEAIERQLREGFREEASRALVLAEASDEKLSKVEAALAAIPPAPDVSDLAGRIDSVTELKGIVADLAVGLAGLQAPVDLVAERIATLLGGPTLTELLNRIDEVDRRLDQAVGAPPARRTRKREKPLERSE